VFGAAVAKNVLPLDLVKGGGAAGPGTGGSGGCGEFSGGGDDGGVHCEVEVSSGSAAAHHAAQAFYLGISACFQFRSMN
jgi:hypothetical protein